VAALRNPDLPRSAVPHVYYDSRNGQWHIVLTAYGRNYGSDHFRTKDEAEAAQPDFVLAHGRQEEREVILLSRLAKVA
jgi:hypothetical protein